MHQRDIASFLYQQAGTVGTMLYYVVHMLMENLYTDFHCLKRSESNPMALPKIGAN